MTPFHYAFKIKDIPSTRKFYIDLLGCTEGRSTDTWIDFNFFGHQLSAHISDSIPANDYCGKVDGVSVKPQRRYAGRAAEQLTMFFLDNSGNPIEFKAFKNQDAIFEN